MTVGIMQPYFFPYIGYWQLMNLADIYVVLEDVSFIKQGFIHKNYILEQNKRQLINLHVQKISSNKHINQHELVTGGKWKKKLIKTIHQNYSKAPIFEQVFPLIEKAILSQLRHFGNR